MKKIHTHTHQKNTPSHQGLVKIQQKQQKQQKNTSTPKGLSMAIAPILPLVCG